MNVWHGNSSHLENLPTYLNCCPFLFFDQLAQNLVYIKATRYNYSSRTIFKISWVEKKDMNFQNLSESLFHCAILSHDGLSLTKICSEKDFVIPCNFIYTVFPPLVAPSLINAPPPPFPIQATLKKHHFREQKILIKLKLKTFIKR